MTDVDDRGIVTIAARLVVRPWRLDDADRLFDIYRRVEVVRWLGTGATPMQDLCSSVVSLTAWRTFGP